MSLRQVFNEYNYQSKEITYPIDDEIKEILINFLSINMENLK